MLPQIPALPARRVRALFPCERRPLFFFRRAEGDCAARIGTAPPMRSGSTDRTCEQIDPLSPYETIDDVQGEEHENYENQTFPRESERREKM